MNTDPNIVVIPRLVYKALVAHIDKLFLDADDYPNKEALHDTIKAIEKENPLQRISDEAWYRLGHKDDLDLQALADAIVFYMDNKTKEVEVSCKDFGIHRFSIRNTFFDRGSARFVIKPSRAGSAKLKELLAWLEGLRDESKTQAIADLKNVLKYGAIVNYESFHRDDKAYTQQDHDKMYFKSLTQ